MHCRSSETLLIHIFSKKKKKEENKKVYTTKGGNFIHPTPFEIEHDGKG